MAWKHEFMVVSKKEHLSPQHVAVGIGVCYSIHETRAEALRSQLEKGIAAVTEVIQAY